MKKILPVLGMALLSFLPYSCKDDGESNVYYETLTVASEMKNNSFFPYIYYVPTGYTHQSYWVRGEGETEWTPYRTAISGFDYEPGYEYNITVKVSWDPNLMDHPGWIELKSVHSKIAKESEGVPGNMTHEIKSMTIASQRVNSSYLGETYWAKHEAMNEESFSWGWLFFPGTIEGFEYEEGYEYVVDISFDDATNYPPGAEQPLYYLDRIVSKTKKTTENLPPF